MTALDFETIVDSTDWSGLHHAYARAEDTPQHLRALASDSDPEVRSAALDHLCGAVLHQGTPYSATAPAALAVAALLSDDSTTERVSHWTDLDADAMPLRASLVTFLAEVAEAGMVEPAESLELMAYPPSREDEIVEFEATMFDESVWSDAECDPALADALFARAALACREISPALVEPVADCLKDPVPHVRIAAANCIAKLLRHPELADRGPPFRAALEEAAQAADPQERAVLLLSLGELGADTSPFLTDPEPMVRTCAALAHSQADYEAATRVILSALETPDTADAWLPRHVPQLDGWLRFTLVDQAIRRTRSFEELLPGALAIAEISAHPMTVDRDWGALLQAAFPPPVGAMTEAQRAYLGALVANERLWDPRNGNASLVFQRVGLPYNRKACQAMLNDSSS